MSSARASFICIQSYDPLRRHNGIIMAGTFSLCCAICCFTSSSLLVLMWKKITRAVVIVWQVLNKRVTEKGVYFTLNYSGPSTCSADMRLNIAETEGWSMSLICPRANFMGWVTHWILFHHLSRLKSFGLIWHGSPPHDMVFGFLRRKTTNRNHVKWRRQKAPKVNHWC